MSETAAMVTNDRGANHEGKEHQKLIAACSLLIEFLDRTTFACDVLDELRDLREELEAEQ